MPEELVVESGLHPEPQARLHRIAEREQAEPGSRYRHGRLQDFAQDCAHVEETGQAHAGLVEPAEILDLDLELAHALTGGGVRRAAPGGDDPGVAGADLHDRVRQPAALELVEGIRAEEPERVRLPQLVPELLEADGGGGVSAGEEQADHLAEHAQPAPAVRGARDLAADYLLEALRIGLPSTTIRASVSAASRET